MLERRNFKLTLMPDSPVHLNLLGLGALLRPPNLLAQFFHQSGREGSSGSSGEEKDRLVDAEVGVAGETAIGTVEKDGGGSAVNLSVSDSCSDAPAKVDSLSSSERTESRSERRAGVGSEKDLHGALGGLGVGMEEGGVGDGVRVRFE